MKNIYSYWDLLKITFNIVIQLVLKILNEC